MPLVEGNSATLLTDFDDQLTDLLEAVNNARRYVHVEFYTLSYDESTAAVFAALADALRRGVMVRVLLDHLGSRGYPGYRRACAELDRMGARRRLILHIQPLNFEAMLTIRGKTSADELRTVEDGYRLISRELTGQEWKQRTRRHRMLDDLTRLTSSLQ
jgi:cardiolipin synthase